MLPGVDELVMHQGLGGDELAYRLVAVRAIDGMRVITRAGYMAPVKTAVTPKPEVSSER